MLQEPILAALAAVFGSAGRRLYLVGGSVRDRLLNRPSPDIDFTTDAPPDEVLRIVQGAHPDAVFTVGEKFGTIGLVFGSETVEITTFRAETYVPRSRHPKVEFGHSLEADLARRDFTINALAIPVQAVCSPLAQEDIVDPFGGLHDLASGVIRAVGVPDERFDEDPLRLLRSIRFASQLGFKIESRTEAAIRRSAPSLADISKERIAAEFTKILVAPHAGHGIRLTVELGLMANVVPELLEMFSMPGGPPGSGGGRRGYKDVFSHTLLVIEQIAAQPMLRWLALLHDVAKPRTIGWEQGEVHFRGHDRLGQLMATDILRRLKLDGQTIEKVSRLIGLHVRANSYADDWTDSALRRLIRDVGEDLPALIALCRADVTSQRPTRVALARARADALASRAAELLAREDVARLASPLDGNDLMALFEKPPGRWIGEVKNYLLELVIEGELASDDREHAERLAKAFLAAQGGDPGSEKSRSKKEPAQIKQKSPRQ